MLSGVEWCLCTLECCKLVTKSSRNVSIARTSGIVLIAGVSSYLAYRIFARVLGNRFLWTITDFARIDLLNRADVRFFCPDGRERFKNNCTIARFHDTDGDDVSYDEGSFFDGSFSESTAVTFLSPESSPIRCCRWVVAHSSYNASDAAPDSQSSEFYSGFKSCEVKGDEDADRAGAQSRCGGTAIPRRLSEISTTFSERSSSIRLQWDDSNWETRSDLISQGVIRRCQSLSPSNVSDFSEFRAARKLFGDITTLSFDDHLGIDEGYMDATPTGDESIGSISDTHEFIEKNCMTDSKHLYRIVTGCSPGSDSFSVNSNMTTRSFQSLRQCAASTSLSNGLLDLTSSPTSSPSVIDAFSNSMTDSAISRGSTSTGDDRWNNTSVNEINSFTNCVSKADDSAKKNPCVGNYSATLVSKKRKENIFSDDRRLFILRRTDLYDPNFSGAAHGGNLKRSGFFMDRMSENSVLYEDCAENEALKDDAPVEDFGRETKEDVSFETSVPKVFVERMNET